MSDVERKARRYMRLACLVALFACILATISAHNGEWSLWAINALIVMVNVVIALMNYKTIKSCH